MKTGMLWFDNDPKVDLQAKIARAADYYRKKYGIKPDLCFVHPSMVNEGLPPRNGIEVRTTPLVLPNHLWIGKHEAASLV
jgi:hypothetical protein